MKLLQRLQDGGAVQAIRVITNDAIGAVGCGWSNKERIRRFNPGRGRWQWSPHRSGWVIYTIVLLSTLAAAVDAMDPGGRYGRIWRYEGAIRQPEEILLDHGPPPVAVYGMLRKRQDDPSSSNQRSSFSSVGRPSFASTAAAVDETGSAQPSVVSPSEETPSTTTRSSPSPPSVPDVPTEPSPLPKPFDGGLGTNYTQQSCPTFLRSMLGNETFSACLPLSVLLQVCHIDRVRQLRWLILGRTRCLSSPPPNPTRRSNKPSRRPVMWCSPHALPSWLRLPSNCGRVTIASRTGTDRIIW
jgi:hypothetical protein